jgi:guanylate kinase
MASARKAPSTWGSVIVISAPSGAGKSTLVKRLMAAVPDLAFSVSYTTRPPRPGEKNGREYFFISRQRFEAMVARDKFLEWAEVFGHLYGSAKKQLLAAQKAGQDILLDIDVQGHRQVREQLPDAVSIFVVPPAFRELESRLRHRHSDSPEVIRRRLDTARKEITHWPEYDYLVVNDDLLAATQALRAVVIAARFRQKSQAERAEKICRTFGG